MTNFERWLMQENLETDIKQELLSIKDDENKIKDAFYKYLSFGTGGLRGVIGAGTNRINIYTIAKASYGLAEYLNDNFKNPSCAIAYDSRIKSDIFAKVTASILAISGIKVYIYDTLMPTPMLSFAVRELKCSGGVVITASHNPGIYNGYKVYGSDGCQITLEAANTISKCIETKDEFAVIPDFERLLVEGDIAYISSDIIEKYYKKVLDLNVNKINTTLKVTYSPLNGAGNIPVRTVLEKMGNIEISVVKEQEMPDGNFTTCSFPNPEEKDAMQKSIDLAIKENSDFALATDPDCDRIGVCVIENGEPKLISGNEMGIMLLDYICKTRKLPENPLAIKTIVTTQMAVPVCKKYGVELKNVLTGFKFIGEQVGFLEEDNLQDNFIFGFEESYGYLSGSFVRDKDAVIAAVLICEMAAYYKSLNKNLIQVLKELYEEYGYYQGKLITREFLGITGMEKMNELMENIRKSEEFFGVPIINKIDYMNDDTGLPKSDVIGIELAEDITVTIRPSGTEPKLKLYLYASGEDMNTSSKKIIDLENKIEI